MKKILLCITTILLIVGCGGKSLFTPQEEKAKLIKLVIAKDEKAIAKYEEIIERLAIEQKKISEEVDNKAVAKAEKEQSFIAGLMEHEKLSKSSGLDKIEAEQKEWRKERRADEEKKRKEQNEKRAAEHEKS